MLGYRSNFTAQSVAVAPATAGQSIHGDTVVSWKYSRDRSIVGAICDNGNVYRRTSDGSFVLEHGNAEGSIGATA